MKKILLILLVILSSSLYSQKYTGVVSVYDLDDKDVIINFNNFIGSESLMYQVSDSIYYRYNNNSLNPERSKIRESGRTVVIDYYFKKNDLKEIFKNLGLPNSSK